MSEPAEPTEELSLEALRLDRARLTITDHTSLRKRLRGARKVQSAERRTNIAEAIAADIADAEARFDRRRNAQPEITYPAELPITARRDELVETIRNNQVVVIAGETGSGKSTQLPKICLEAGFGVRGMIGHTQPRRIAARSVAARIAEELGVDPGGFVGHAVRFDDRTSDDTAIKVMTDGILLAELTRERDLSAYDLIIVDEAHERSLNIDFLLGYLHRLVRRRPDLHVVVTSATIDTEKIASHFHQGTWHEADRTEAVPSASVPITPAPIIEVSGRTYPVEIRYQPRTVEHETAAGRSIDLDAPAAVRRAVEELTREGPGDILVFSSGEAEINDICESLRKHEPDLEVLPLYARLSTADQQRVFSPSKRRRVVVATNVAETSLTVPGIRYVIDLGEARMSRFSQRTKVQRLPIEAVSQASANQRSGRCGRLGPGIAIRLYDQEDFETRDEFTEPEIQRTNLASVILTMADQGLGAPGDFPFIDPPEPRAITDGARLLHELGAVKDARIEGDRSWLTGTGRKIARLPIDPRLGRIVLGGADEGCLHEATIIAAGLAVQDPRERPRDKQGAADAAHEQFQDPTSDFLSLLHLWHAATDARRELTRRKFTRWCRDRFLHGQRMIEWFDTLNQLKDSCDSLDLAMSWSSTFDVREGPADADDDPERGEDIHRAVLTGMLSQIGMRIERSHEYLGPRNARFAIQPGSTTFGARPDWIMSATLVETSRLWARTVAPIDPEWVEAPAAHLTTTELGELEWDPDRARAITTETIRLFGLPVVADRLAPLDRHDRAKARELFIHHALIEAQWTDVGHAFLATNDSVRHEARNLTARSRRRSFDDEYQRVWDFYDSALPADITSAAHFERWFGRASADHPHLLELSIHDLLDPEELVVDETSFPERVEHDGLVLDLDYVRSGGDAASIAVDVPLPAVGQIEPMSFLGVVPGHRRDAVIALVRAFPKPLRKRLVPVPETVDAVMAEIGESETFALALRQALERRLGETLPLDALDPRSLPPGLRPEYRVVNDDGDVLARGHDITQLRAALAAELDNALDAGADGITHAGATSWDFGDLPREVTVRSRQGNTLAYPTLVDRDDLVGVELVPTAAEQSRLTWHGARRLLRLTVASPLREMNAVFDPHRILALELTPHGDRKAWFEDLTLACLGTIIDDVGSPWSAADFSRLQKRARADLPDLARRWAPVAGEIIDETAAIRMAIVAADQLPADCVNDARNHLERLTFPGHLSAVGVDKLDDLLRYLRSISHRLAKLPSRINADRESMHQILVVEDAYDTVVEHLPWSKALEDIAWSIEELRVSMFAQHLGTTERVSPKRIRRSLERLTAA
ncbi:MAG: ATP-dependent RNA helicase HrpA [Actinomycetota bacterium]